MAYWLLLCSSVASYSLGFTQWISLPSIGDTGFCYQPHSLDWVKIPFHHLPPLCPSLLLFLYVQEMRYIARECEKNRAYLEYIPVYDYAHTFLLLKHGIHIFISFEF